MKQSHTLLLFTLFLFLAACSTEQEKNNLQLSDNGTNNNLDVGLTGSPAAVSLNLEHAMSWASFIAVKVLINHPETRSEWDALLSPGQESISLNILLSDQAPRFFTRFCEYAEWYFTPGRPNDELDIPPGMFPTTDGPTSLALYLDFILQQHCLEFFFPSELHLTDEVLFEMTSSSHPLNTDDSNEGVLRFNEIWNNTRSVTVDADYVADHFNIIVTRPVVAIALTACDYSSYDLDFTLFLND